MLHYELAISNTTNAAAGDDYEYIDMITIITTEK